MRKTAPALFALLSLSIPAGAQELEFLGGTMRAQNNRDSYSWQISYRQGLGKNFAWSLSWLNEGHVPSHHRDGPVFQLWARTSVLSKRFWLSAGAGPYRYFDTEKARRGGSYRDTHGWAGVYSAALTFYLTPDWFVETRANRVLAHKDVYTSSLLLGVGYQFDNPGGAAAAPQPPEQSEKTTWQEITVFTGKTIVNSYSSEDSSAFALEYRKGLAHYLDGTVTYLKEGDPRLIRRDGVAAQLWPTRAFLNGRFTLGIGLGVYANVDSRRKPSENEAGDASFSGLITMTMSVRLGSRFSLRASWNRTATNYNRDTDVILYGIGCRFGK